jgi:hypothetical protein
LPLIRTRDPGDIRDLEHLARREREEEDLVPAGLLEAKAASRDDLRR